jgi:hypothetical protein
MSENNTQAALLEKTGVVVRGLLISINEYYAQKSQKTYWSVDLKVKGTRSLVNVKLPAEYDRSKLVEFGLAQFSCTAIPNFQKNGLELIAINSTVQ